MGAAIAVVSLAFSALAFATTAIVFAVKERNASVALADTSLRVQRLEDVIEEMKIARASQEAAIAARDQLVRDHQDEIRTLQDTLSECAPDGVARRLLDDLLQAGVPEADRADTDRGDGPGALSADLI